MDLDVPQGHTLSVLVLSGTVRVDGREVVHASQTVSFGREGGNVTIEAIDEAKLLVLGGESIDEPVEAHCPFVMNTPEEIDEAMAAGEARSARWNPVTLAAIDDRFSRTHPRSGFPSITRETSHVPFARSVLLHLRSRRSDGQRGRRRCP